uniref:Fibronectin type-III domain-containing protein n=1 Tax=Paramormyrops kingsleyae TaxID=1676925 RepID=A0A3B3QG31_9TELE
VVCVSSPLLSTRPCSSATVKEAIPTSLLGLLESPECQPDPSSPPGPPSKPETENVTNNSVTITWKRPYDGGLEITGYIVEHKKEGEEEWVKDKSATPLRITEFVIANLQPGGKYYFRVSAMNAEGFGEAAQTEDLIELVDRMETPEFELDAELRRTLVVKAGNSIRIFVPIKGRPPPEVTWMKEDIPLKGRAHIDTTESYTLLVIPDLRAENDFGIGEPVEMPDPVRASQAPTRPEKVNIADITKNSVSLVWTKPKHDGGNRITGYVIEAQKKGSDQWSHVTAVKTLDYVVKNLNENEEYTFRVMAVNNSGRSDPCNSRPVVVKEQNTEPEFDLHGICHRSVIAKAGDDIKVEIPVFGHPKPSISWKKDDQTLKLTPRVNTEDTPVSTILSIGECTRSDSGQYSITGKNMLGTVTEIFTVKVHDIPGPPKGPIKNSTCGVLYQGLYNSWVE